MRASCAYWLRNGLKAIRTAANQPAFCVPQTVLPAHHATGMASSAQARLKDRTPSSLSPASPSQKCRSM